MHSSNRLRFAAPPSLLLLLTSLAALGCSAGNGLGGPGDRPPMRGEGDAGPGAPPSAADSGKEEEEEPVECFEPGPGCPCPEVDSFAPCYTGPAGTLNVGICEAGRMVCSLESVEFPVWGECEMDVTPSVDNPDNNLDEDCNGDVANVPCVPSEFGEDAACGDGMDNDCDGLIDCNDLADCPCPEACEPAYPLADIVGERLCSGGRDDDCDGLTDCEDPDCRDDAACCVPSGDEICGDGIDNDCNRRTDCDDAACDCEPPPPPPCMPSASSEAGLCSDGVDNDCDGARDCDDSDCDCSPPPMCRPTAENCGDGIDNDCDDLIDCDDPDCDCTPPAPERLYAHTSRELLIVQPGSWSVTPVGSFGLPAGIPISEMTDLAIDNAGGMVGVVTRGGESFLYEVNPTTGRATLIGPTGVDGGNSLTYLADGRLVMGFSDGFYMVDPATGRATRAGNYGSGISTSGDLSGTPRDGLFLAARVAGSRDRLVRVDPNTGRGTFVGSTDMGQFGVFGFAYWDGNLYGFTNSSRQIIEVNLSTGAGRVVATTSYQFTGAAVNQRLW